MTEGKIPLHPIPSSSSTGGNRINLSLAQSLLQFKTPRFVKSFGVPAVVRGPREASMRGQVGLEGWRGACQAHQVKRVG